MDVFVITLQTKNDSCFCHVATTLELGVKWIEKYGMDWHDDPYAFIIERTLADKDDYADSHLDFAYYNSAGKELTSQEYHEEIGLEIINEMFNSVDKR